MANQGQPIRGAQELLYQCFKGWLFGVACSIPFTSILRAICGTSATEDVIIALAASGGFCWLGIHLFVKD